MKAAAPGKIILFGEHAVVYGRPALAVPVTQVSAQVDVSPSGRPGIWIEAPGIGLNAELGALPAADPIASTVRNFLAALHVLPFPDLSVRITSTIPVASGLGSGAAVSVALIRGLAGVLDLALSDAQISQQAFEIEKLHHGTPSGIDNSVITYQKPVYFVKGHPIEVLSVGRAFQFVIGDTGIQAPTRDSVGDVRRLREAEPAKWEAVFDRIGDLVRKARPALENGDLAQLGTLMNENHALLQQLTVSSIALDRLVDAARNAGALGAKLSGGGRGGNMIAIAGAAGAGGLARALSRAGATRVITSSVQPQSSRGSMGAS